MTRVLFTIFLLIFIYSGHSLYLGPFQNDKLKRHDSLHPSLKVSFYVGVSLRNVQDMKDEFLDVSSPRSGRYGKFLSIADVKLRYSYKCCKIWFLSQIKIF